jgi:hypothetical protein
MGQPMGLELADGVPMKYAATVGRIIVSWAQVEYRLRLVAKRLLGIGQKQARIALAEFRAVEMLTRIEELAELRNFRFNSNIPAMKDRFSRGESRRNLIAHSAWLRDGASFQVQYTKGRTPGNGRNRRLYPEGIPVTRDFLSNALRDVKVCVRDAKTLVRETDRLVGH